MLWLLMSNVQLRGVASPPHRQRSHGHEDVCSQLSVLSGPLLTPPPPISQVQPWERRWTPAAQKTPWRCSQLHSESSGLPWPTLPSTAVRVGRVGGIRAGHPLVGVGLVLWPFVVWQ